MNNPAAYGFTPEQLQRLIDIASDDKTASEVGELLADALHLRARFGRYETEWGSKTAAGLARTVLRLMADSSFSERAS